MLHLWLSSEWKPYTTAVGQGFVSVQPQVNLTVFHLIMSCPFEAIHIPGNNEGQTIKKGCCSSVLWLLQGEAYIKHVCICVGYV